MIREEAIKELKEDIELYIPLHGTIDDVDRDLPDGRLITALEMGIKALEQEPCEDWYDVPSEEMTLEQARQAVNDLRKKLVEHLDQGSCTDAISRQAAIDAFHTWFRDGFDEDKWWNSTHVLAAIEGIPSVHQKHEWETCFDCPLSQGCPKIKGCTNEQAIEYASEIPNGCPLSAQPKVGHWIYDRTRDWDGECKYECSECGMGSDVDYAYCMRCGAKMVEPQEKEDKE